RHVAGGEVRHALWHIVDLRLDVLAGGEANCRLVPEELRPVGGSAGQSRNLEPCEAEPPLGGHATLVGQLVVTDKVRRRKGRDREEVKPSGGGDGGKALSVVGNVAIAEAGKDHVDLGL